MISPRDRQDDDLTDSGAWGEVRTPDFTARVLGRVDRVQPFVNGRGRLAMSVVRVGVAAAALGALVTVGLVQFHYPSVNAAAADRPVTRLVSMLSDESNAIVSAWWPAPQVPQKVFAASAPARSKGLSAAMLAAWSAQIADGPVVTNASLRDTVSFDPSRLRPTQVVARASEWVWGDRRAQAVGTNVVNPADQVSSAVAGRAAPLSNPD